MPAPSRFLLAVACGAFMHAAAAHAQPTGLVPINDLGAGTHGGFPGGLYPGSLNVPPADHLDRALVRAAEIVPRNASGVPDPHGWIGMIALGMSNTTHEFGAFERLSDADTTRNARVVIMDTGFGGQTASVLANPSAGYWTTLAQRVAAMGLTAAQVQVAWLKEAEGNPPDDFPLHAIALRETLERVVQNLHDKYPNVKICYVSSRIFGGYSAPGTLNPEPQAYESGFSVKWLIEDQINGDPGLDHGQLGGTVRAPVLLWGPYLWADGTTPRSDGLVWNLADLESDRVHPSPSGELKVAQMLADFFANDTTTQAWWPAQPGARLHVLDATHDAHVSLAAPGTNFGSSSTLIAQAGASAQNVHLRFDATAVSDPVLLAKLSLRVTTTSNAGGTVRLVSDATWDESTITWSTAPALGTALVTMPQASRDGTFGAQVTNALITDADDQLAFAITTPAMTPAPWVSEEGGQPPRLVLVLGDPSTTAVGSLDVARRLQVWPNPGETSHVRFSLGLAGAVELDVIGIDGRRVRTLARSLYEPGSYDVSWDGRDDTGRPVAAGVYLVRLVASGRSETEKVIRLR